MRVVVELWGMRRRNRGEGRERVELDVEENTTVSDVLVRLGVDLHDPWNASLDGTLADPSDKVSDGSHLIVFPPITGGGLR